MTSDNSVQVNGTFQVQIGSLTDGGEQELLPDLVHEKSELSSALNSPSRHTHIFSTNNLNVVDKLLKAILVKPTPLVQIRVGLSSSGGIYWFPWQTHIVTHTDSVPQGLGYTVTIVTGDLLEMLYRKLDTKYHHGLISNIVTKLAAEHDIQCVVEPTRGNWSYIQSNQSDLDFIRKLASKAVNSGGRGGYRFFVQDNVLHFHTVDFVANVRDVNVFSLSGTQLALTSRIFDAYSDGAGQVRTVGVDPYSGKAFALDSDKDLAIRHGNQSPKLYELGPVTAGDHPSQNRLEELLAQGQSTFNTAHANSLNSVLTIENGYPIQLNDVLRIILKTASPQQSPWGGLYSVTAVTHMITKGSTISTVKLQRGEFLSFDVGQVVIDDGSTQGSTESNGRMLDIQKIGASTEMNGPPNSFTGGRTIKQVQPPT